MRTMDSAYDRRIESTTTDLIEALIAAGHTVETPVTGSVIVDGDEITPADWDRLTVAWDGTDDGLEDIGF